MSIVLYSPKRITQARLFSVNYINYIPTILLFYFLFSCISNTFYQKNKILERFDYFHHIHFFILNYQGLRCLTENLFINSCKSAADATAVNFNGIKTLLAKVVSIFIISKPTFINGPSSLPRDPPDCVILETYILDRFILAAARTLLVVELFANSLQRLAICLLGNDNLFEKLVSSL